MWRPFTHCGPGLSGRHDRSIISLSILRHFVTRWCWQEISTRLPGVPLFSRSQNLYMGELTLQQSAQAVTTLLQLSAIGEEFPVKVEFNDYSFVGFAVIQNEGDLVASLGTMTRVITLAMAYVSGNVASGSGRTLQA